MIDFKPAHTPALIIGFLIASMAMGAIHRRLSSSGSFIAVLYCLPFTIMHESSHFVAALLTGGRPSSFSVWPRRSGNGWILGSVTAVPTLLSATPTALAPLGWLAIGYYSVVLWEIRPMWMPEYLIVGILYACTAACTPSWQDIKVALTHPFSSLLWAIVAYILINLPQIL
ncbi:MAG: hypothetical protein A2079_07295 [Geobacteraceae bacterium GWC2_48_7]|nr:MAG: hypothetical protein A2079_07295 [Geobacteraceae bacterium GWC2_48_7]